MWSRRRKGRLTQPLLVIASSSGLESLDGEVGGESESSEVGDGGGESEEVEEDEGHELEKKEGSGRRRRRSALGRTSPQVELKGKKNVRGRRDRGKRRPWGPESWL